MADPTPKTPVQHTINVAKWATLAVGALGFATQIAGAFLPKLVTPLQTLGQLLGLFTGQ